MFELSLAIRYLIPRRARLSVALIGALSVAVVSLVVWLILVFLSVTEGIEKGWLNRLTTLHAPIRITPTNAYYASYYYQIDSLCSDSSYQCKNIQEKSLSKNNPYNPEQDGALPVGFPKPDIDSQGHQRDLVQEIKALLDREGILYQDFEMSSALLKLQLLNPHTGDVRYLTQASYLATPPNRNPSFKSLLVPATAQDASYLIALAQYSTELSCQDNGSLALKTSDQRTLSRIRFALQNISSCLVTHPSLSLHPEWIEENASFQALIRKGVIEIPLEPTSSCVTVTKKKESFLIEEKGKEKRSLSLQTPLMVQGEIQLLASTIEHPHAYFSGLLQGNKIAGRMPFKGFKIERVQFQNRGPSWLPSNDSGEIQLPFNTDHEAGILLAKSFLDNGVHVGDRGYLSYASTASGAMQEHRLPIFVSGFYDPGVLSIGNKCILVPHYITKTINASSSSYLLDQTQMNGFLLFPSSLEKTEAISQKIQRALQEQGLDAYWKVTPYTEYEFAKDLLGQFQSDKILFMLVGILILIVGCCNIVSMGVLLVNDKKKEIGILQAMGASKKSILQIFAYCGILVGLISCTIGTTLALITLHNLDILTGWLSIIQGREAFNPTFFGSALPNTFSPSALLFILIVTPLLSLVAGLLPAIKACRLQPSNLLKSE